MTTINPETQLELMNFIGEMAEGMGLSRIAGQLYAVLYLSSAPVCLDELVETCQVSKGSVSTNIRALERWQAVKKVFVAGDRKDYYEANPDIVGILTKRIKEGVTRRLDSTDEFLDKLTNEKGHINRHPDKEFIIERINNVKRVKTKLIRGMKLLDKLGLMR